MSGPTPQPRTNAAPCAGSVTSLGSRVSEKCLPVAQHPAGSRHSSAALGPGPCRDSGGRRREGRWGPLEKRWGQEASSRGPGLWILCLGRSGLCSELQALD